jgi:hypothetical protein
MRPRHRLFVLSVCAAILDYLEPLAIVGRLRHGFSGAPSPWAAFWVSPSIHFPGFLTGEELATTPEYIYFLVDARLGAQESDKEEGTGPIDVDDDEMLPPQRRLERDLGPDFVLPQLPMEIHGAAASLSTAATAPTLLPAFQPSRPPAPSTAVAAPLAPAASTPASDKAQAKARVPSAELPSVSRGLFNEVVRLAKARFLGVVLPPPQASNLVTPPRASRKRQRTDTVATRA